MTVIPAPCYLPGLQFCPRDTAWTSPNWKLHPWSLLQCESLGHSHSIKNRIPWHLIYCCKVHIPEGLKHLFAFPRRPIEAEETCWLLRTSHRRVLLKGFFPLLEGKTASYQLIRTSSCNNYEALIFGEVSLNPNRLLASSFSHFSFSEHCQYF